MSTSVIPREIRENIEFLRKARKAIAPYLDQSILDKEAQTQPEKIHATFLALDTLLNVTANRIEEEITKREEIIIILRDEARSK